MSRKERELEVRWGLGWGQLWLDTELRPPGMRPQTFVLVDWAEQPINVTGVGAENIDKIYQTSDIPFPPPQEDLEGWEFHPDGNGFVIMVPCTVP